MPVKVPSSSFMLLGAATCIFATVNDAMGQCSTHQGNSGTICCQPVGPDVIVGVINGVSNYSAENINGTWYDAFSFGTTSCNLGNTNLKWNAFPNNQHPAIAQGLFKYKVENGYSRIEQIGQSWLKHGFLALTENACGCGCSGQGGNVLGVGCSDPYTAARNGTQGGMGPKWQVDASSGYFPNIANPPFSGSTARRLRVRSSEVEATSATARFFGECQYVTQDDAAAGNKNNNASYREVTMTGGPNEWTISFVFPGNTVREQAAINAWKAIEPDVVIRNVITPETPNPNVALPNQGCCTTGLVIVASKAFDLGNGMWHYEYAVQNVNSDRSIASFSVPLTSGVQVTNIGFHDVDYHSNDGEASVTRDGTDWAVTVGTSEIKWETTPYAVNANANALRWGTLYNFRFDANVAPDTGTLVLGTWKVVGTVNATNSVVPGKGKIPLCPSDTNGDKVTDVLDLLSVINGWGACVGCAADTNNDGLVDVLDLLAVINGWGPCE